MVTDRQPAHPLSEQCTAKSKRSGERCRHFVIGAGVCWLHGGKSPRATAAREARIVVAEALAKSAQVEARDPGDALVAAAQDSDSIVQRLKAILDKGDEMKPSELRILGDWLDRAGRLSKTVLDARVDERRVRLTEAQLVQAHQLLAAVLVELGHDPGDPDVIAAVESCGRRLVAGERQPLALARGEVIVQAKDA